SDLITEGISASDYLVVLISPNTERSNWVTFELSAAEQLTARDITIIPVLIAEAPIPISLNNYLYLDCREDLGRGIERLIDQISAAPNIDFSRLTPAAFEDLVADLLARLDFRNIVRPSGTKDVGYDIRADYQRTDPFGLTTTETWLVECKFYQRARANLRTIAQFVVTLSLLERNNRGLLVMNSQLTSVALEQLANFTSKTGAEIKVIESPELKRLLIKHRDLIKKYFSKDEAEGDEPNH
ncbi:MAG: hypothetical protein QOK48_1404, partial [Blastocatellia bacterium]|nr:hypothetical protein [Blastocatellia bacterium]